MPTKRTGVKFATGRIRTARPHLPLFILQPDAVQTIRNERFAVEDVGAACLADGAGQVAGGVELQVGAKLGTEPLGLAIQQPGGAQHKTVLQTGGGVLAQNGGGRRCGKVDLGQLGGLLYQRRL